MSASSFLVDLLQRGVQLWKENGKLRYRALAGVLTPTMREEITSHKAELLPLLDERKKYTISSFAQQRLWFLDQWEPGSPFYNIPAAVRLRGPLDAAAFEQSLNEVISRHESLRTTLTMMEGQAVQVAASTLTLTLQTVDLGTLAESEREARLQQLAIEEAQHPFDLGQGPLIRATLIRLGAEEHVLLLTMHHIVSDAWSMTILIHELATLYKAFSAGRPALLPKLPLQYADLAVWQRQWLRGETLENQLGYWKKQLGGAPAELALPTDRPRPPRQAFHGACQSFTLSSSLSKALETLSKQEQVTLFMTLLATFKVLLYRYTGQTDIIVGSPIANRNRAETEGLIGFFVNTLVLRTNLSGNPSFRELLRRVREVTLGAYAHQDLPFEMLVEQLQPQRNLARTPLFQVMVALQNVPVEALELPGLSLTFLEADSGTTKFDLSLSLEESGQGLKGLLRYNTDLFDAPTITRLLAHWQLLLEGCVADPDQRIAHLPLLTPVEQHQLLVEWNDTQAHYPRKCVHELFQTQAERTPDAVAVVFKDQHVTYHELDSRTNRLAHYMRSLGVGQAPVGLCVERSVEMVVGILGVFKAGGACVPLDPAYPPDRLAFMLQDTHAPLVLTHARLVAALPECAPRRVCLDSDWPESVARAGNSPLAAPIGADTLACVIYTSGTTGWPKGVMVTHQSMVNYLTWANETLFDQQMLEIPATTNLVFDACFKQLLAPLLKGRQVWVLPEGVLAQPDVLLPLLRARPGVGLNCVPSAWKALLDVMNQDTSPTAPIRALLLGGEAIDQVIDKTLTRLPSLPIWNLYGPTEATANASAARISSKDKTTIGRPIANTQIYIFDSHLQPVPVGVPGELYIGGDGLAWGYLNQPGWTADKFVPNPYSRSPGARLYRTGDMARYQPGGNVEFLGRVDHQVKVRGFRVELSEIEAALGRHPAVQEAVVMASETQPEAGEKQLVAYVLPKPGQQLDFGELRRFLKQTLPDYMLPSALVTLDALPVLPSGKLDRRALPAPGQARPELGQAFAAPRTPLEAVLANIWGQVLGVKQVGIHDDFFESGGHSLLAIRVVSRVRDSLQVELPLRQLFEAPTVAGLANKIEHVLLPGPRPVAPPLERVSRTASLPLSFSQERIWFLTQLAPASPEFNMPAAMRLAGRLDKAVLEQVLNEIVRRHESLRTAFVAHKGRPTQLITPALAVTLPVIDLQEFPIAQRAAQAQQIAVTDAERPFDITCAPLFRASLLELEEQDHILLLNCHHIVSDGWSYDILLRELAALYTALTQGQPAPLPELPIQYADYAHWQRQFLQADVLESELGYWKQQLAGPLPVLEFVADRSHLETGATRVARQATVFPRPLMEALKALSRQEGATLFMTLLAAFKVMLYRCTGQTDLVVATPIANRDRTEIEEMIGCFLNTLILRTDLAGNPTFTELLGRVRHTVLAAFAHKDLPFERLVDELQPERELDRNPLFQVVFVMQDVALEPPVLPDLRVTPFLEGARMEGAAPDMLGISLQETEDGLAVYMEYQLDFVNNQILGHFQTLLESIAANPNSRLSALSLLTETERQQLLVNWNENQLSYPHNQCFNQLFEAQVECVPESIAAICDGVHLAYDQLNRRANRLASVLVERGVGPDTVVALLAERGLDFLTAMLATFKAGGAYLPLDPYYPPDRLSYILEHSTSPLIVAADEFAPMLADALAGSSGGEKAPILRLPEALQQERPEHNPPTRCVPRNLAYVIYTSGSTGLPKGAMIEQRGMINHLYAKIHDLELSATDIIAQTASQCFDISVWQFLAALAVGGCVHIFKDEDAHDPARLLEQVACQQLTILETVPALLRAMLEQMAESNRALFNLASLRWLVPTGEALPPELARQWLTHYPRVPLINAYGPTECSDDVTHYPFSQPPATEAIRIPLGRPIANTQLYILDNELEPVPVGVAGELYVGGDGVGRGYLREPRKTAPAFIPDPFSSRPGARLYRTSDLGFYRPDGVIEFLGRVDHQVKIRGFRIELGEIEAVLEQHPAVQAAVAVAREDAPGDPSLATGAGKRLVAYVMPEQDQEPPTPDVLRQFLQKQLPDYMAPAAIMILDAFPLTPNGKVDRKALPAPDAAYGEHKNYVAPESGVELKLAEIWSVVLGVEREQIGVFDSFFELGGHSLLATQAISRINAAFRVKLPLRSLFEELTIANMALLIEETLVKELEGE